MNPLTHLDNSGAARMVDVGEKPISHRVARASCIVEMAAATLNQIRADQMPKGDVLAVARLAGIQAAKRTSELIPLCHSIPLDSVTISLNPESDRSIRIEALVTTQARTGVEMEALVAASCAGLALYDMCKSVDRTMQIRHVRLEEKKGGRSGDFRRQDDQSTHSDLPT
jgi:cyclic pyranopterin phosphate synthase